MFVFFIVNAIEEVKSMTLTKTADDENLILQIPNREKPVLKKSKILEPFDCNHHKDIYDK